MSSRPSLDRSDIPGLVAAVVVVNVVGAAPAALGGPNSAWFVALEKPALYPPPWTFGVVWTTLFTLLGVALYLVWSSERPRRRLGLGLFVAQMALNVVWTPTFFLAQNLAAALAVILALLVAAGATAAVCWRVDRRAGALFVPYLLWVAFAALLNYQFIAVN